MVDIEASIQELRKIWGQGPGIHKRPSDLLRYEHIIAQVKPAVVVETGLYYGGSQLWFSERVPYHIAVELPDSCRDERNQTTKDYRANRHGLGNPPVNGFVMEGHSHCVLGQVYELAHMLADGDPILVVLDSEHSTKNVYGEAVRYCSLVTPGSYMVVEDTLLHHLPHKLGAKFQGTHTPHNWFDGDPWIAVQRFLERHPEFAVDVQVEEMFPTTQHPGGWLRRTK